jgi:hypothetical protein
MPVAIRHHVRETCIEWVFGDAAPKGSCALLTMTESLSVLQNSTIGHRCAIFGNKLSSWFRLTCQNQDSGRSGGYQQVMLEHLLMNEKMTNEATKNKRTKE